MPAAQQCCRAQGLPGHSKPVCVQVTRELGLHLYQPEESVVDMFSTLLAEGILKEPKLAKAP